ncbi:MAG TPA: ribonuclease P protein component [Terriglobales bacterium]|nr:ribonuclease P protein component [Terriglobales bacterium]
MVMLVSAVEGKGDASDSGARKLYPRSMRLLRHADFERVYQQGRRHFSAHMTVFYLRRQDTKSARVGYTVSRALGGAVDRNRVKRRLREAVRLSCPELHGPLDIVINPKKSLLQADFEELKKEVARALAVIRGKN